MSDIINFVCVRIQGELDAFEKTSTLPHTLLDGVFTVDDILNCRQFFSPKYQDLSDKLVSEYSDTVSASIDSMKESLKREYNAGFKNSATASKEFWFPQIAQYYRADINPVRALYYEVRAMINSYNDEDQKHVWLAGLITDKHFNNQLLDALAQDIARLEKILKRYYWPMLKHSNSIPLELFHARQLIKDARHYYNFFKQLQNWDPE